MARASISHSILHALNYTTTDPIAVICHAFSLTFAPIMPFRASHPRNLALALHRHLFLL